MSNAITVNRNILDMEYAVRGPIPQRAAQLKLEGKKIIPCNIGNPQALGQKPITFYRQVLGLLEEPSRISKERQLRNIFSNNNENDIELMSKYVLNYAEDFLSKMETGMGAYTDSKGPLFIREAVAKYIDNRDKVLLKSNLSANSNNIFITDGASEGAKSILELLITKSTDGIMIPIPQYPLYSATIRRCGGTQINYYPDEDSGWKLNKSILENSYSKARENNIDVKAIVVINPGNPTGSILDQSSINEVIDFADKNNLIIISDEVYQENLYGAKFISFASAVKDRDVPLFSLHSTSKGFYGECGHRGGYFEIRNAPKIKGTNLDFVSTLFKQASVNLCSNTVGQAMLYMMVNPPAPDTNTYKQFDLERQNILDNLYEKALIIKDAFNKMDGVESFGQVAAMYLFPRLNIMPIGKTDYDYCMGLLEETGLTTVNGSGFGQKEGTFHLRIAFLPSKKLLEEVLPKWIGFHNHFVNS